MTDSQPCSVNHRNQALGRLFAGVSVHVDAQQVKTGRHLCSCGPLACPDEFLPTGHHLFFFAVKQAAGEVKKAEVQGARDQDIDQVEGDADRVVATVSIRGEHWWGYRKIGQQVLAHRCGDRPLSIPSLRSSLVPSSQ